MNNLQIFKNTEFGQIRVIEKDGQPWFVGKDVAEALGYKDTADAIKRHVDEDDKGAGEIPTPGGIQAMILINESGLYSLVLSSKLESAKKFKRWVTSEVLPTIRKTGGYVSNDDMFINTYLPFADESTKVMFKSTLEIVRKQNEQIQLMKPKVDYFDALVERNLLTNFRDTAKELKVPERTFMQWLEDKKFIYRDIKGKALPYAKYVPELFELKEWARNEKTGNQTLVTPKGRETFRLLLIKDGLIKEAV
ncbi:BRO family protein [Fonticella tunisiensis]|uniref:Phage antirepressor protein KilAC domain-containing protein n=1 Tax=Fonticella tunisiensis TaxID=1096341 RepID=A0A4R7KTG7_9CLOT|nr:BRO family protein [Fonticella tunisiensis]TDT63397.1 phage antirepressor protein KilAC domain-containing protein [Fonticella tunisiensis]